MTSLLTGKWLYRALLQEAKSLHDIKAQEHYVDKIRIDFRKPLPLDRRKAYERTKDYQKLLRQLIAANSGHIHSIDRVLQHAYARKGKSSRQAFQPFLNSTFESRSLTDSPTLKALTTSSLSHTRPINQKQLTRIPTLPPRADPDSEEAKLLGVLIPQRVKALKRRWWNLQTGKIISPVRVEVEERDGIGTQEVLKGAGIWGMSERMMSDGKRILQELEKGTMLDRREEDLRIPRRLRKAVDWVDPESSSKEKAMETVIRTRRRSTRVTVPTLQLPKWESPKIVTPRFMRRRYEGILAKAPIVVIKPTSSTSGTRSNHQKESEDVDLSKNKQDVKVSVKLSDFARGGIGKLSKMSEEDVWWAENVPELTKGEKNVNLKKPELPTGTIDGGHQEASSVT